MRQFRKLNINLSPAKICIKIPAGLSVSNAFISVADVRETCKRHNIPIVDADALRGFLLKSTEYYRRLQIVLPQLPQLHPTIASRKEAEALFLALGTFLELFTSPSMVPRVLHAYQVNRPKCSEEQNNKLYDKTVDDLEMLLFALETAIDFDGRAHIAGTKVNHAVRFMAPRILKYWNEELLRPGPLSGRASDGTALGFVLECLGLITGDAVSEHLVRGADKPEDTKKKRKRVRVRRR